MSDISGKIDGMSMQPERRIAQANQVQPSEIPKELFDAESAELMEINKSVTEGESEPVFYVSFIDNKGNHLDINNDPANNKPLDIILYKNIEGSEENYYSNIKEIAFSQQVKTMLILLLEKSISKKASLPEDKDNLKEFIDRVRKTPVYSEKASG